MCNCTSGNDELTHPEKIALPDFHAIVAQDAVRGRGMKVKVREREIIEELLSL